MADSPAPSSPDPQKLEDLIRELVEHLRKRKARPDMERICRLLDRRHGVTVLDAETALERMVAAGTLMRVEFKGNFSFRNVRDDDATPAVKKRGSSKPKIATSSDPPVGVNSANESRQLRSAVRRLMAASVKQRCPTPSSSSSRASKRSEMLSPSDATSSDVGVKLEEIQHFLSASGNGGTASGKKFADERILLDALRREVRAGSMRRLSDGSFAMASGDVVDDAVPASVTSRAAVSITPALPFAVKSASQLPAPKTKKKGARRAALPMRRHRKIGKVNRPLKIRKSELEPSNEDLASKSFAAAERPAPATRVGGSKRKLSSQTEDGEDVGCGERPMQLSTPVSSKRLPKAVKVESFRVPIVSPRISSRLNKRKRFKKTHGPDFVENYDSSFEEPTSKCDYCLLTEACNRLGEREELLVCKDCSAKAHPSCMNYSDDLALRSRRSPWQCLDCKTCYICQESENADSMLFCDSCDKGFHMGCHHPLVSEKPTGKWMCEQCQAEADQRDGGAICSNAGEDSEPVDDDAIEVYDESGGVADADFDRLQPSLSPQPPTSPTATDTPLDEEKPSSSVEGEANQCTVDGLTGLPTPCDSPVPDAQPFAANVDQEVNFNDDKENVLAANVPDATEWSIEEVEKYLNSLGFSEQAKSFREQEIDGKSLLLIKRNDILTGLSLKLGPALKIYKHVRRLQVKHAIDCSK